MVHIALPLIDSVEPKDASRPHPPPSQTWSRKEGTKKLSNRYQETDRAGGTAGLAAMRRDYSKLEISIAGSQIGQASSADGPKVKMPGSRREDGN